MRPHQAAAGVVVMAVCLQQFGWIRTLAAGLALAGLLFGVTLVSRAAQVLAQTYTETVAQTLFRKCLDGLIAIGSVLRRSGGAVDVAIEAMAMLDEIATGRVGRLRLAWEAICLGVGAARTTRTTSTSPSSTLDADTDLDHMAGRIGPITVRFMHRGQHVHVVDGNFPDGPDRGFRQPDIELVGEDGTRYVIEIKQTDTADGET